MRSKIRKNEMQFSISDAIKQSTTDCEKGFLCLEGNIENLCKVKENVEGKILFIECIHKKSCYYMVPFGHSCLCDCPTRKELFNKYNI
jgi:hypothetical protein